MNPPGESAPSPAQQAAQQRHDHVTADLHAILQAVELLGDRLERKINAAMAEVAGARAELAALALKVAELEQEFGPVARKFNGSAIAGARAALLARRSRNDGSADRADD